MKVLRTTSLFRFGRKLAFALALVSFASIAASPVTVQVFWNLQPGVDLFVLHGTNDITQPMPWPVITTFVGSSTNASLSLFPGTMNFYLTARNFFGESGPSNVASTDIGAFETNSVAASSAALSLSGALQMSGATMQISQ